ncbi:twin-arginine translocase TatA/TatE family subunit [Pseudohaliea sp.]|uniref:twin-arginine translocase TatA/TatE family subunit n=1 Tax=Pseudohaliea sp. TaxID=2740289 RepID=UPI0032ED3F20
MGLGGISIWQLLIILAIVIMLFGTKRLRGLGSDLGGAIKGFKKSMQDEDTATGSAGDEPDADTHASEERTKNGDKPAQEDDDQRHA